MSESPTKTIRPLEIHSPNVQHSHQQRYSNENEFLACSSPSKAPPRMMMMPLSTEIDNENENEHRGSRGGGNHSSFVLSPIVRVDFGFGTPSATPASGIMGTMGNNAPPLVRGGGHHDTTRMNDDDVQGCQDTSSNSSVMDASFPDVDFESQLNDAYDREEDGAEEEELQEHVQTEEEERMMREIEESEALARQLMAEEAMASYAMSTNYLRDNADQFSEEDLMALQAAMAEEDPDVEDANEEDHVGNDFDEDGELIEGSAEMSYDALLRLGEQIGDVKEERWALVAREKINAIPTLKFTQCMAVGKEENHTEVKCQVCQFAYEEGEELRRLPLCGHCFHKDCVDSWLERNDTCAFCRKSIVPEK